MCKVKSLWIVLILITTTNLLIADSLVAHWAFDEGSGSMAYDSVGSNDGSLQGDPSWTDGLVDGCLEYDGSGDYVSISDSDSFTLTDITLCAWVRFTVISNDKHIITNYSKDSNAQWYHLKVDPDNGYGAFQIDDGSAPLSVVGTTVISDGSWHFLVGVRDLDSDLLKIYVDGVLENSVSDTTSNVSLNPSNDMWIGGQYYFSSRCFNGLIDDVRIYDYALDADDIMALYDDAMSKTYYVDSVNGDDEANDGLSLATAFATIQKAVDSAVDDDSVEVQAGTYYENISFDGKIITVTGSDPNTTIIAGDGIEPTVSFDGTETSAAELIGFTVTTDPNSTEDPNLIGYWSLDGDPNDYSGYGNQGSVVGVVEYSDAFIDYGLDSNGIDNNYISVPDMDFGDQMSGGLWVKFNDTSGGALFGQDGECGDGVAAPREFYLQHASNTNTFRIRIDHDSSTRAIVNSNTIPVADIWYHVFWTYDGSEVKLYVNGTLENSGVLSGDVVDNNWKYGIAADDDGEFCLDGMIDDVRLYNRALSASEVAEIARNGNQWSVPVLLDELNDSSLGNPNNPSFSSDGLDVYFSRLSSGNNYGVFTAHRSNLRSSFGLVTRLDENSSLTVAAPCIMNEDSGTNPRIYSHAGRILVSDYDPNYDPNTGALVDWENVFSQSVLDYYSDMASPSLTEDELTLVFHSGYPTESGFGAEGDRDIMIATRATVNEPNGAPTLFGEPVYLSSINTQCPDASASGWDYCEYHPHIMPDGLAIYFDSNRDGTYAIYRATRESSLDDFGDIERIEFPFYETFRAHGPYITSDERVLYFDVQYKGVFETHRLYGSGIFGNGTAATIKNCVVEGNQAYNGGGIAECDGLIQKCVVKDNVADCWGGGLYDCDGTIDNCLIAENMALCGGGLDCCDANIINCTVAYNEAEVLVGGMLLDVNSVATVTNCIIYFNTDGDSSTNSEQEQLINTPASVTYNCIEGWSAGGVGNISSYPLFVDPNSEDYRITVTSPCVDAGSPNGTYDGKTDLDGFVRAIDIPGLGDDVAGVDMGAYEFNPYIDVDVLYVDVNNVSPIHTGTSWEYAFDNIHDAIALVSNGAEIWVAGGTYLLGTEGTISIGKSIEMYGGFAGYETERSQRDWGQNNTIIDGEDSVRCLYVTAAATIDGLVITRGYDYVYNEDLPQCPNGYGGGLMFTSTADNSILRNCVFYANKACGTGGAVFSTASGIEIVNCVFVDNEQTSYHCYNRYGGGAIYYYDTVNGLPNMTITNSTFYRNSAGRGGAIMCQCGLSNANPKPIYNIQNCLIFDNSGDNLYVYGTNNGYNSYICLYNCLVNGGCKSNSYAQILDPDHTCLDNATDPVLFNTDNLTGADGKWMTADDGLMLSATSGCVNAGSVSYVSGIETDITGANRIDDPNNGVDIGAYEY